MTLRFKNGLTRNAGIRVWQFILKRYTWFKPLVGWVSPRTRSRVKTALFSWVFKKLYGQTAQLPENTGSLGTLSTRKKVSLINSLAPLKKGVNLVGYPRAIIGEGEFVRQTARSFQTTSRKFGLVDCHPEPLSNNWDDQRFSQYICSENPFKINIFHLKPDQLEAAVVKLGKSFVENRYNIGYWVWELSEFPDAWQAPLDFLDEVWCPSRFIQSAVKKKSANPVLYLPTTIQLESSKQFDRDDFSLPKNSFIFLFVFDFKSYVMRKNPHACIRAFQKAFPVGSEPVTLVLKSMDGSLYPQEFACLQEMGKEDSRIVWMDKSLSYEEMTGLMEVCDSFVSLHRSEGIGLGLAQSMLLGKPVIATNYSGNTDFMHEDNSCLVNYELIKVGKKDYPFSRGQVWAEPDVDHAAWYMRRLVKDESYRESIALKGKNYIRTHHNPHVIGRGYERRLQELGLV